MKNLVFAVTLLASFSAVSALAATAPKAPKWCKPCLYYSGDIDTRNPNADAVWNDYYVPDQIDGQILGAFKDTTKAVTATGAFINAFAETGSTVNNPTPYQITTGASNGNCGTVVCAGSAKAKLIPTGRTDTNWGVPTEYAIVEKKLEQACTLKRGSYWLLIYPQSNYLWYESGEVSDPHPINHVGWKNVLGKSIFNSTAFGENCQIGGAADFSFGLIGK